MGDIKSSYPIVFSSKGSSRPHSQAFRDFKEKWGFISVLYDIAEEKVTQIGEIYQLYLSDFLQYLTYMSEKADMDRKEDEFQQKIRASKRR